MSGNVVVDGTESASRSWSPPPVLGLVAAVLGAALLVFVVGASPSPAPAPPAPGSTFPDLETDGDAWRLLELPGSGSLRDVTSADDLVVAVGDGPQFWRSRDGGSSWERSGQRWIEQGSVAGVATGGLTAAAGHVYVSRDTTRAALWVSRDGLTYRPVAVPDTGTDSGLDGMAVFERRFVAWGWEGSPEDFAPGIDPVVLVGEGGSEWRRVSVGGPGVRIRRVTRAGGRWLAMGSATGRPALWSSPDLEQWEAIPTDGMPFGWTMVDGYDDGTLTVNLLEPSLEVTWRWRRLEDGSWRPLGDAIEDGPVTVQRGLDGLFGVGQGVRWETDGDWIRDALDGEVAATTGRIAVGARSGQPAVWLRGSEEQPTMAAASAGAAGVVWSEAIELGEAPVRGPFPVGDRFVVGAGGTWWAVEEGDVPRLAALEGRRVERIDRVGDEWVASPAMLWTGDGERWEQRGLPWEGVDEGLGTVRGVTEIAPGRVLAIGSTDDGLAIAAESTDGGATWVAIAPPAPATPVRDIRALPGRFIGVAARPRNTSAVVETTNGRDWTPLTEGDLVRSVGPVVLFDVGDELAVADTGERITPPQAGLVDAATRSPEGVLALISGPYLLVGPGTWDRIPVDPGAGVTGTDVRPVVVGDEIMVVDVDRGVVRLRRLVG